MVSVYEPSDDSFFFKEFLEDYLSNAEGDVEYLDMGTGSGILAKAAAEILGNGEVIAADINPEAVKKLRSEGYNVVKSDLFENVMGKFDVITFNAPYLPDDSREPIDSKLSTTGGKNGDEVSVRFLEQAKKHLNPGGKIFLLISSLTPRVEIDKFNPKEVARMCIPNEELIILEFS